MKKAYNNESISQLKGADRVRKRPGVIFGSDSVDGCQHSFFEILSNAIDEARSGYGSEIKVIRHSDHSITVSDKGRGIPVDFNTKENKYNWELLFTELYAGGKYDSQDSNYSFSLGLNGLGLTATQYASEYMQCITKNNGYIYTLKFEKGEMTDGGFIKEPYSGKDTGTVIKWKPDLDVFKSIDISLEYFKDVIKKQSIVNPKIHFILEDESSGEIFTFFYENGITDYVEEISQGKSFSDIIQFEDEGKGRDRADLKEYKVKFSVAFAFNNEVNKLEYFHNSSYLEHGGSPDKAVKNAFVAEIDVLIKKQGKYNKGEKKISFQDVEDSLVLVSSSFSEETSYENQTKKSITNKFVQDFMTEVIRSKLEVYFVENMEVSEKVVAQVLINKRSREKAESTRLNLKKTLSGKIDVTNKVKKFVDCRSKDKSTRELYILEGDSALGSCKLARDAEFQALMPIRGKILNCLKADYDKIFKSEIIVDLIKVLGCGVEIKSRHKDLETFSLENFRWNKLIICTDADVDGFQIRTLVLGVIYALAPTLIDEGLVYIAESPLYEINVGEEAYFAYNEQEKTEILKKLKNKKNINIQRSKGLGENDPEMMWQTTMNPETRRLIKVMPEDESHTSEMFEIWLGDDIDGRKKMIEEKGEEYLELLDIS